MAGVVYLWHVEKIFQGNPVLGVVRETQSEQTGLVSLVYSPDKEIDGHWFVRVTDRKNPKKFDPEHDIVIGVTSHKDRIAVKLYDFARKYAKEYAVDTDCEFRDETLPGQSQSYKSE